MRKSWGVTAAVVTMGLWLAVPGVASAADRTVLVKDDFVPTLSDTRATGHYEVVGTGLRIWTEGSTSTDKVAEYVAAGVPLAGIGEPALEYTPTSGSVPPGFQLVMDMDGDGARDSILVGEAVYAGEWWAANSSAQNVKDGAPATGGGFGSLYHGTLDQWRTSFPDARVQAFGFSLGSGVQGDGVLDAIRFDGDRYTFGTRPVDTTGPVLTCDVPAPGPTLAYGSTAQVSASVTDAGSGPAAATTSATADTTTLGARSVTLTASDVAGNVTTTTCPYTVVAGSPASVVVVSGSGQSAPTGTAFAQPVRVRVTDQGGNPVASVPVTFSSPASGPSGTFVSSAVTTDETGTAAVTVTATGRAGSWRGSASVAGLAPATFTLTNTAAPAKKADLKVTVSGPAQLWRGQTGTYVLTVKNQGPDAAVDVLASVAFPTSGVKVTSTGGGTRVGNLVVWPTVRSLASGSSTTFKVTVKATCKGSYKVFGSAASLRTQDPVLSNNVGLTGLVVR